MKLNIAYPATACQKVIEIEDEKKLMNLYDKRMSQEVEGGLLGDEFKGYVFRISGGNDKQGFAMHQGILSTDRVRLLADASTKGYRCRRVGERKRVSFRGCIVAGDIAILNLVITKKGDAEIPGITDENMPRRLGPKRASKLRTLFNLGKEDDVRKYVISRTFTNKKGKEIRKAPSIQRLVTPLTLQRKRSIKAAKKNSCVQNQADAAAYRKLAAQRSAEQKEARRSAISKRRSTRKSQKTEKA